ncbi:MAG TPA: hypothetical protein DIC34_21870 [Treponema sp.]|nr:hypothetical protein [Treponema sp.]
MTMTKMRVSTLAFLLIAAAAYSQTPTALVVPDRFLRGYDPVTVLYDRDVGPSSASAVPGPGPYLSLRPAVDGEYRWEDARTLRFLPSAPWPPLRRFTVVTLSGEHRLSTMVAGPESVSPAPASIGLEPFSSITLTFPGPIQAETLRSLISVELRDLPGVSGENAEWLPEGSFSVRELESGKSVTRASYRISLREAVPYGKRILLHLALSDDPSIPGSVADYSWETKSEFRMTGMGAGSVRLPVSARGAAYAEDQALDCGVGDNALFFEFSDRIAPPGLEDVKRAFSFEPAVRNLRFETSDRRVSLRFEADRDRLYRILANPAYFVSASGRRAVSAAPSSFHFYFKQESAFVSWKAAGALVERYGPRLFPMEGRGTGKIDLRLQRIDPLSYDFFPFPRSPVAIEENSRPPMPGEEPAPGTDVAGHIRLLLSPTVSKVADLPVSSSSPRASWGLDVGAELDSAFGKNPAGSFLIGYRTLDKGTRRYWVRVDVTDLCLTVSEEERALQFLVTSLSSGEAVPDAEIRVEGRDGAAPVVLLRGRTDKSGLFRYEHRKALKLVPYRVVVTKADDLLVQSCGDPPPSFANNHWFTGGSWLSWLAADSRAEREKARYKGRIATERPVYRPGESVHAFGWVRDWRLGKIGAYTGKPLVATVSGPDGRSWTFDLKPSLASGALSFDFLEADAPTGEYVATLSIETGQVLSSVPFKILSYRIPLFQVDIDADPVVPMDKPFELLLTATYYAGGRVTGEEVSWEIEQYPWSLRPAEYPGFVFSTDERFSQGPRSESAETGSRTGTLDQDGAARLLIDPRNERDGKARRYVISGTVRGADRQTVTRSASVYALPPFSVGLKTDRLVKEGRTVRGEFLAIDHKSKPLADRELSVRLIHRQWHSYVAETDFTTGDAKYVSESVDAVVAETSFVSGPAAKKLSFEVEEPGVYILEVSSRDHLGRRIIASSDLFVSAEGPVSWDRKRAGVFEMTTDKNSYKPGETAKVVVESPYRDGFVLLAVEAPDAVRYSVVPVKDGRGTWELPISADMAPSIPVQAILYRGRAGAARPASGEAADLGKPSTVGSSLLLRVAPVENQVLVGLDHVAKATPAQTVRLTVNARDTRGAPLDGEATVWLVDKAVLSLGEEQPLDPLVSFLDRLGGSVRLLDTRNRALGFLPVSEVPGGDGAEEFMMGELFNRSTVRKNFKTVPYFKTGIPVVGGKAVVDIDLPDNLTDFAVRVVVTSGLDRFGSARSELTVRLAVALQQILPRFVRPWDEFEAGATARVVEGEGGEASWAFKLGGFTTPGGTASQLQSARRVVLPAKDALRLFLPLSLPGDYAARAPTAAVSFAMERASDKARDAFELDLPVRSDAAQYREYSVLSPAADGKLALPPPSAPARAGTIDRTLLVATDPRLLVIARGFRFLDEYPHGCLEQVTSRLFPSVALKDFIASAGAATEAGLLTQSFAEYRRYLQTCQAENGLLSYWPDSEPSVALTAYVVEFLAAAEKAGLRIDRESFDRAADALDASLRSDYYRWELNWEFFERVQALSALDAAGRWNSSYAGNFLEKSASLDLLSRATLYRLLKARGEGRGAKFNELEKSLVASLVTKRAGGATVLAGVKDFSSGSRVLVTETRTVAAVLEALSAVDRKDKRLPMLADWLLEKAGAAGWGSTMDTVAASRALAAWMESTPAETVEFEVASPSRTERFSTKGARIATFDLKDFPAGTVSLKKKSGKAPIAFHCTTTWYPLARGSGLKARNEGFLVEREFIPVDGGLPPGKAIKARAGETAAFALDQIVEEHVTLTNFMERDFVALDVPLAAGFEPLDPRLAGASPDAIPYGRNTIQPSWTMTLDDRTVYYFNSLPKGTFHFFFRSRASFPGSYTAPQAKAELMYDGATFGFSDGCAVRIGDTAAR